MEKIFKFLKSLFKYKEQGFNSAPAVPKRKHKPKSALIWAKKLLSNGVPKEGMPQAKLYKEIAKKTKRTTESVASTLNGYGGTKMCGQEWFKNSFVAVPLLNQRVMIMNENDYSGGQTTNIDYDHPEKQKSRVFALSDVIHKSGVEVLTLAGPFGYDVKYIKEQNPSAVVVDIEKDLGTYNTFLKQGLDCRAYLTTLTNYLKCYDRHFHVMNLDFNGHYSTDKIEPLRLINERSQTDYLSLTFTHPHKVRGPGKKTDSIARITREKYKHEKYQTTSSVKDLLTNYTFVNQYEYKTRRTPMITIKFKLNTQPTKGDIHGND